MAKYCLFLKSKPPPPDPFDPGDGSWYWVTTSAYGGPGGAIGNGVTDDRAAIQSVINAAVSAGKGVYLPEGNYLVGKASGQKHAFLFGAAQSGLKVRGERRDKATLLMAPQASESFIFRYSAPDAIEMSDLGFACTDTTDEDTQAFYCSQAATDCTLKRLSFDKMARGIKIGSGDVSSGWTIDDIVMTDIRKVGFFTANVEDSSFTNLDLRNAAVGLVVLYVERGCSGLVFDTVCGSGGARAMQLWMEHNDPSSDLTFRNMTLSNVGSNKYCVAVNEYFSDVLFEDCIMDSDPSGETVIMWYGGTRIVFDGFTASGGSYLIRPGSATAAVDCEVKNGTYAGPAIGSVSGVTVSNVTVV